MASRREHWDSVYRTKLANEVSWFQRVPALSLDLIYEYAPNRDAGIIDIGGGASSLSMELLHEGYKDVSVLDISAAALDRARERVGSDAANIEWIVADIAAWQPHRLWNVWHDRAVFHFLTDTASQNAYISALKSSTATGAIIIIAGFALDGPESCSGLPVVRYDASSLSRRIGDGFELLTERLEDHRTPRDTAQKFYYAVLRKR